MSTRRYRTLTLGLVLVAALSGSLLAQAPAQKPEGSIFVGATIGNNTGNLNRVAEYDIAKDGTLPTVKAQLWGDSGSVKYDLFAAHSGDSRDQKYGASINAANGRVKASFSFDRFLHRLDHDPLTYVEAGVGNFVVRATDHDPGSHVRVDQRFLERRRRHRGDEEPAPLRQPQEADERRRAPVDDDVALCELPHRLLRPQAGPDHADACGGSEVQRGPLLGGLHLREPDVRGEERDADPHVRQRRSTR